MNDDGPPTATDTVRQLVEVIHTLSPANLANCETKLGTLVSSLETTLLARLDYDVRWIYRHTSSWPSLSPRDARRLINGATDPLPVAASLSMHTNGRIRELAVRSLGRSGDYRAVRWLVLRTGDWVPEVRQAAIPALTPWLAARNARLLVDVLPLLEGARFDSGRPGASVRSNVFDILQDPASEPAVVAGAGSTAKRVRRACVSVLLGSYPTMKLLELVVATHDVIAISKVAKAAPTSGTENHQAGVILSTSSMARFRAEGLWRLLKGDDPRSESLAWSSLSDPAPAVRQVAQYWMTKKAHDVSAIYRDMLAVDRVSALNGLGDRPQRDDAPSARIAASDETSAVRVAALRFLSGLGESDDDQLFAELALHGSSKERRYTLAGLERSGGISEHIDAFWVTANASDDLRLIRFVMHQCLPRTSRWKRIDIALQAIVSDHPAVRDLGFEGIVRVFQNWNQGYPSQPGEIDLLRQRLANARPELERRRAKLPYLFIESLDTLLA